MSPDMFVNTISQNRFPNKNAVISKITVVSLDPATISTIIIKKALFYKKAPLVCPGSGTRGGFLINRPEAGKF